MPRQILKVITPATGLQLLTPEELRVAAGLAAGDVSQDADLAALGLKVAAAITSECNVAVGAGAEPTLLRETLQETIFQPCGDFIFLSRRHDIEVLDIAVDGTSVSLPEDIDIDPEAGIICRLSGTVSFRWSAARVAITYKAGFEEAPGDLKIAATDFFRLRWMDSTRDPSLKSERTEIVDVEVVQREYWVGSVPGQSASTVVPDIVAGQLQRYRNMVLA
jgi:hypothetical protein